MLKFDFTNSKIVLHQVPNLNFSWLRPCYLLPCINTWIQSKIWHLWSQVTLWYVSYVTWQLSRITQMWRDTNPK